MKFDKLKSVPHEIKQLLKPEWKRIALLVILFLILPQKISNDFTLFGGVYLIRYLFETYQPSLDIYTFAVILISSYLVVSFLVWLYDKKINKFIVTEGEETVNPPEEEKKDEPKEQEKEEKAQGQQDS
jgi:hypothetical protein